MSLPNIPAIPAIPSIPVNSALSLLLVSIALEEIGLSHIINAEGEKIQAVVEAFSCGKSNIADMLAVDKSAAAVLRTVLKKELLLEMKMTEALEGLQHCPPPHCAGGQPPH